MNSANMQDLFLLLVLPSSNTHHPSTSLSRTEKGIFVSQVLSAIGLPEAHDARGVQPPGLGGAPRRDAEAERGVLHVDDDDALQARAVLGVAADVGLDDVGPVQERLLAVGLDPDLVARVLGQHRERRDGQPELARLGELAQAGA
jgi:hypothetical protein